MAHDCIIIFLYIFMLANVFFICLIEIKMCLKCVLWRHPFIADFHLLREGLERNPHDKRGITVVGMRMEIEWKMEIYNST